MKVAIMQPYFFPYIGYFQLIKAVDSFVIYDDVNYINKGWINRNRILVKDQPHTITLSLSKASQNKLIHEIYISDYPQKILKTIRQNYCKSPQFSSVYPLIEDIFSQDEKILSRFLIYSLRLICDYLNIRVQWHISSDLKKDKALRGQEKVLAICEELKANHYINAPGGRPLYDQSVFLARGIALSFIQSKQLPYKQFGTEFVPNLSIIDVMMFNDRHSCAAMLGAYEFT